MLARGIDPPPVSGPPPCMALEPGRKTTMSRKRHKPEEIVAKLRQVDVLLAQGHTVADAIRSIGVTEVIVIESWRRHYNTVRPHASLGYRPPAPEVFVPGLAARPAAQRLPASPAALPLAPRPTLN